MKTDREKVAVLNKLVAHYGIQYWWEDENRIKDWVSMILIQQTTELNASRALNNLESYLSVDQLLEMDMEKLQELIRPAGFFRQKSDYIKGMMQWFVDHGKDFDKFKAYSTNELRKEVLTIKGVGPETADAMLLYIFERNVFIADTYAIRLFNRLGFGNYNTYAQLRKDFNHLAEAVPHELCKEWHAAIDVHGKSYRMAQGDLDERWLMHCTF